MKKYITEEQKSKLMDLFEQRNIHTNGYNGNSVTKEEIEKALGIESLDDFYSEENNYGGVDYILTADYSEILIEILDNKTHDVIYLIID